MPLIGAEPTNQEQHHADTNVGKDYAHPYLIGQRIQEGKHAWFGFLRLFDHDRNAQTHERL